MSNYCGLNNGCYCECTYLHTKVEYFERIVRKSAIERKRQNINHGEYVGSVAVHTTAIMALDLCDWCQDEVVSIVHEIRKISDHRFRVVCRKKPENEQEEDEKYSIDLTVDE